MSYIRVWVGDLHEYNCGRLVGGWVDVEPDMDDEEAREALGIPEEHETAIFDCECDIPYYEPGEHEQIEHLSEIVDAWDRLDDDEQTAAAALMWNGEDIDYAFDHASDCIVWNGMSMRDIAEEYADGLLAGVPDEVARYFDYDAYARDLSIDGNFIEADGLDAIVEAIN